MYDIDVYSMYTVCWKWWSALCIMVCFCLLIYPINIIPKRQAILLFFRKMCPGCSMSKKIANRLWICRIAFRGRKTEMPIYEWNTQQTVLFNIPHIAHVILNWRFLSTLFVCNFFVEAFLYRMAISNIYKKSWKTVFINNRNGTS